MNTSKQRKSLWGETRCVVMLLCALLSTASGAEKISSADLAFFESQIRPLFIENCYKCHSVESGKSRGGLVLDSAWGWQTGGESGPVVVPGKPDESLLMRAIQRSPEVEAMPPKSALPAPAVAAIEKWIAMGAPDPRPKVDGGKSNRDFDLEARKNWWSLQPVKPGAPPRIENSPWPRSDIDRFILAKLSKEKLVPAEEADRRTWIRRATFDLTGLPPQPDHINNFLADSSAGAHEKVIDRLLASPRFGEHWATHWMDLVRFAETKAFEFDYSIPYAYRYRDYLIRTFNNDVPYNQFALESIAGDLLEQPRIDPESQNNESAIGPGFFYLTDGQHGPPDIRLDQARVFDSMIDTVSKTFLAQTISCAKCHDHKFDAITTADYYSLYGILAGSRLDHLNVNDPLLLTQQQSKLAAQKDQVRDELSALLKKQIASNPKNMLNEASRTTISTSPPGIGGLSTTSFGSWRNSGRAFGNSATSSGEFITFDKGDAVIRTATGGHPAAGHLASRFGGSIKSPDFTLSGGSVHVRVKGKNARVNLYVQNYELVGVGPTTGKLSKVVNNDQWEWVKFDTSLWQGERAYIEVLHNGGEFKFVSRAQHRPSHVDGSYVIVAEAHQGSPPKVKSTRVRDPKNILRTLPSAWSAGRLSAEQSAVLEQLISSKRFSPKITDSPSLKREIATLRKLQGALPMPHYVRSLSDGDPVDQPVFIRGSHTNVSKESNPRHFMDALDPTPFKDGGSGRLAWAKKVVDPNNPLTARVMVNRVWHHLFGRGIVASTDDLGQMGDLPSHPELLDHLADRFVSSGWSVKKLIKEITLSSTYRMSSVPSAESIDKDPNNKYLQHVSVRRLGAEAIRDAVLSTSGELRDQMYGPSVPVNLNQVPRSREIPKKSGPLDGAGRRSIYMERRRNFLPSFLLTFDMPNASQTFGRRNITNVPAQSLTLLNDPFIYAQAEAWAKKVITEEGKSIGERISSMHEHAFGRPASATELNWAQGVISALATSHGSSQANLASDLKIWKDFCHTMLNRKELIYVR